MYIATVLKYGYKNQNIHTSASKTAINLMGDKIKKLQNEKCRKLRLLKVISRLEAEGHNKMHILLLTLNLLTWKIR